MNIVGQVLLDWNSSEPFEYKDNNIKVTGA